jgi:RNA polymerase sigma factor (sigma-70 family)
MPVEMTENSTIETYNIESKYELPEIYEPPTEVTEQYLTSLDKENRKAFRKEIYDMSDRDINFDLYENLKRYKIFELDLELNQNDGHHTKLYEGAIQYNPEGLKRLKLGKEDMEKLKKILDPKEKIDYIEAEALFNGNPTLLLASMTILANEYNRVVYETDSLHTKDLDGTEVHRYKPRFLFTQAEETIFLTGRTLLQSLNKQIQEKGDGEYIDRLISDIDAIIMRFNEGLIGKFVSDYAFLADTDDLFQQGNIGIIKALGKFDIDKGHRFSTYAGWWIRREVQKYTREKARLIKLPAHTERAVIKYEEVEKELETINGEPPTFDEVVEECKKKDINLHRLDYLKKALLVRKLQSLDEETDDSDDDTTLYRYVSENKSDIKDEKDKIANEEHLRDLIDLAGLTPREIRILKLRYELTPHEETVSRQHYYYEIANKFGLTKERIRQIQNSALRKLRKAQKVISGSI